MHSIQLLNTTNYTADNSRYRSFVACINGVRVSGKVTFIYGVPNADLSPGMLHSSYRFYFPKELKITRHKDYKNIRRELLSILIDNFDGMVGKEVVIR